MFSMGPTDCTSEGEDGASLLYKAWEPDAQNVCTGVHDLPTPSSCSGNKDPQQRLTPDILIADA